MEARFGRSFADVRVHSDPTAAASADAVNALAYTVGRDIVFAAGRYAPRTPEGAKLLAHELTHVVQQTTAPANTIRRVPGQNAQESWDALVTVVQPQQPAQQARAGEAIRRMLQVASGARLMNQLWTRLRGRGGNLRPRVTVRFVDELPREYRGDASGCFHPPAPNQSHYTVWVKNEAPLPSGRGISLGGSWPGGTANDIQFTHTDSESSMAATLQHELLHVWFIHTQPDATYPTGHGDVMQGEIEPLFLERIRVFSRELDDLEARIHRDTAARQRPAAPPPRAPETPSPSASAEEPVRRPSPVGGEVSLHGGGGAARGAGRGVAILGADLVLNRLVSFRLGVRGVYLTPDRLLAGGSVGLRILQGDGSTRPVTNPLFFDIEAGVLAEITPTERDRISRNISVLGSIGVGQELGREGPRFFWRVGGMVIVSDQGQVAGAGTAGVGLRY